MEINTKAFLEGTTYFNPEKNKEYQKKRARDIYIMDYGKDEMKVMEENMALEK